MSFKDRIRKGIQQEQQNVAWNKQPNIPKTNSKKDLFKTATNILTSQQFEPGDFKRNQNVNLVPKKRNSSILEMECQQDIYQNQVQQNYYNGGVSQRMSNNPNSMVNSNAPENYTSSLFESKLYETKGQLSEQILDVEKRMKKQIQRDRGLIQDYINRLFTKFTKKLKQDHKQNLKDSLQQIVVQLNNRLQSSSKKHKIFQSRLSENQDQLMVLTKQFSQFTLQTQEKIQKIINSNTNAQVANSMKKSLSRNMGNGDYIMELKNSIKDIPVINPTQLLDQIKQEMQQTQQSIRFMRGEITNIKEDLKSKIMNSLAESKKQKHDFVQISKITYLADQINNLKNHIHTLQSTYETQEESRNKYKELRGILQIQEQNWIGINDTFHKAVNLNIIPRLKKTQEQIQSQSFEKQAEYLKKQVVKQLQSMPIIRVKTPTVQQKQKIQRMKTLPKSQQQMYMLDESNYILDCFGHYLLDQNNQRIKLEEQQIYYLEQVQGIQIKIPSY